MSDYEFEAQTDLECKVENFEESRNWNEFSYAENEAYLTSLEHLDIYKYLDFEILLNRSKDAYLVNSGYAVHPLRTKRNKNQKLKNYYGKS